jgi:NAD(P)-dependent dehydrogenase (short-subunit alcohol dehydrogenase family)
VQWTAADLPELSRRTVIVTGANSGVGWHTARELASRGARVVLACRDVERAKQAADRIRSAHPSADVEVEELDLASMRSVRSLAERWDGPLDLLINNAGVMAPPRRSVTSDGFELQFGTNHLGHFVLTGLLLPALLESGRGRVVTVCSVAHFRGAADVVEANAGLPYVPQQAYANSKLANLLFAAELHRRCSARSLPVTSTAAHPGVCATGLVADRQGMGANWLVRLARPPVLRPFLQPARAGARASLYAAALAPPGSYTGPQHWGETRGAIGAAKRSALAADEKLARRLWSVSEELTGFRYTWPR